VFLPPLGSETPHANPRTAVVVSANATGVPPAWCAWCNGFTWLTNT